MIFFFFLEFFGHHDFVNAFFFTLVFTISRDRRTGLLELVVFCSLQVVFCVAGLAGLEVCCSLAGFG